MTAYFDPSKFTSSARWWDNIWGGGHNQHTYPVNRGWRAALSKKGGKVLIVGRHGVEGCFSVMELGNSDLDVATYYELTPKQLAALLEAGRVQADAYKVVDNNDGWAMPFIQAMEAAGK